MCVVSFVSDRFVERQWPEYWPSNAQPPILPDILEGLNNAEIQRLKSEIVKLKQELEEARKQDIKDGNPDCHVEDKVAIIKGLAKALDVDLGNVFEGHK
jgi:hypothetical protein